MVGNNAFTKKNIFNLLMFIAVATILIIFTAISSKAISRLYLFSFKVPKPMVIDPFNKNPYMLYMRPYVISHIPNSHYFQSRSNYKVEYKINSLGFRGPEVLKKNGGFLRLLVIGDSFVEGHGCDYNNTFSFLLSQSLQENGWEVINVGVQGGSPITYACNINRYLSLEPDAVLIMIFENDLQEDRYIESYYFDFPFMADEEQLLPEWERKIKTLNLSRIYYLFQNIWKKNHKSPLEETIWDNKQNFFPDAYQKKLNTMSQYPYLVAPTMFEQGWYMSQKYLDYVVKTFQERGVDVLIANLSVSLLFPEIDEAFRIHALTLNAKVSTYTRERHIPFLSLLLTLKSCKTNNPYEIIIENDRHLTKKGHRLIAQRLRPWLIRHLPK